MYEGGLRETYVCDVLSSGFGASVLSSFGELGPVPVGHGGGPEWSGTGCLGDGTTILDTSRAYGNADHVAVYLSLLIVFPTCLQHHLRVSRSSFWEFLS